MKTQIVQKAFDHLRPGGYFEAQEVLCVPEADDGTLSPDSALVSWVREVAAASDEADRMLCVGPQLRSWLGEVGFEDVREAVYKIPVNGWPRGPALKHIGQMWQRNLVSGLSGFSLGLLNRVRGRTLEDIEVSVLPCFILLISLLMVLGWNSCSWWT